jgi:hypothetical protein
MRSHLFPPTSYFSTSYFSTSYFPKRLLAVGLGLAFLSLVSPPAVTASQVAQTAVLTQNNDNARTGANTAETTLTTANVNAQKFGKLFTISGLDANVNGQVLYDPNVQIGGVSHNVLYAYTSNNTDYSPCSVYAFDADTGAMLWHTPLLKSATYTTATPVIDPATNILYVLSKTDNDNTGKTYLHAYDITTGAEKTGSPIQVTASAPGSGAGNVNGVVSFDGPASSGRFHANDRTGLLLLNGVVYTSFAHNSDSYPYHGWILGYSYDGTKFTQTAVFCTTPNGGDGGIWQAGKGLTADNNGYIYCSVGNGTFDADKTFADYASGKITTTDFSMCYLKLRASDLKVIDWFAPYDESDLSNNDLDLGNSGLIGIPGTTRLFGGATKFGTGFLLDSANLGRFTPNGPDNVLQRLDHLSGQDSVGQNPIAWDASSLKYVYLWPGGSNLEQFALDPNTGTFTVTGDPTHIYKQTTGLTNGGSLAVSANGSTNGILWAVGNDNVVRAFDASDVSKTPLWTSAVNSSRDRLGSVGHFQFPTVVHGKVYVPTGTGSIVAYGLLPVVHLSPTADAPVRAGQYANTNYGTDPLLICKRLTSDSTSDFNRADYLKFDLTTIKTAPSQALLTLTINPVSRPARGFETIQLYSVADTSWTESGITWNNAPGLNRTNFTSTGTLQSALSVPMSPGTASFDITASVKANLGKVVTLQLIDGQATANYLAFDSRDAVSGHPQLTLVP